MKLLLILFIFVTKSFAFTIGTGSEQRGLEVLMGGVGQARLGSYGSLAGNSSLMAWGKLEQKFISTNIFSYAQISTSKTSIEPKFIPTLAASIEKVGDLVLSYGLIGDSDKFQISANVEEDNEYRGMNTSYSGVLALAKKVTSQLAIGLNFSLDYFTSEVSGNGSSPQKLYSFNNSESAITSQIGVNFSYKFSDWAIGGSFKTPFAKYWSEGKQLTKYYDNNVPDVIVVETDRRPSIVFERESKIGLMKKMFGSKIYLDLGYIPGYKDGELEEKIDDVFKLNLGQEFQATENYNFYYGVGHVEDNYSGIFGFSKANKHSRTFYGLGYSQDRENQLRTYQLAMGTFFDY